MRELAQVIGAWLLAIAGFCLIRPAIRRQFPKLTENMTGTISWVLAWIAVIGFALLIYPYGWMARH
jgi:uncharacterized membrane protein